MRPASVDKEARTQHDTDLAPENQDPGADITPPMEDDSPQSQQLTVSSSDTQAHPLEPSAADAGGLGPCQSTTRSDPGATGEWAGRLRRRKPKGRPWAPDTRVEPRTTQQQQGEM